MIDSKSLVHLPPALRYAAIGVLLFVLAGSATMTAYFLRWETPDKPQYTQWILMGIALVQMALTGLAAALILFFTEREVSTEALQARTDFFLDTLLPDTLARVSPNFADRHDGCRVARLGRSDIFGAAYELAAGQHTMRLWVGLNVRRLIVIYWLQWDDDAEDFEAHARNVYRYTFGGAERVGFSTFFERAQTPDGSTILSIWSTAQQPENLLLQPSERLFWMQDVAMMTESLWRTSIRNQVRISPHEPGPL